MIHLLKDQKPCDVHGVPKPYGSHLIVQTRCGAVLMRRAAERLEGATIWASRITCADCLA